MLTEGFMQSQVEKDLYTQCRNCSQSYILTYLDDNVVLAFAYKAGGEAVLYRLNKETEIIEDSTYYSGVQTKRWEDDFSSQKQTTDESIKDSKMFMQWLQSWKQTTSTRIKIKPLS